MRHLPRFLGTCLAFAGGCAIAAPGPAMSDVQQQVADTERAFARTMAQRDFAGFVAFLAEEAVFFSGPVPLHGKEAVAAWWKKYYDAPDAPFSWEPDQVEVLASGTLAMTSGPVHGRDGKPFARFTSVWRREPAGNWRIVFDKGQSLCTCEAKP